MFFTVSKLSTTRALQFVQVSRFAVMLVVSIALAKLSYPISEIGKYESFLFITTFFSQFWFNSILQLLLSNYSTLQTEQERKSLLNYTFTNLLAVSAIISIAISILGFVTTHNYLYTSVYLFFSVPSMLIEYKLLLEKRSSALFYFGVFSNLTTLLLCLFAIFIFHHIVYTIFALILVSLLRFLVSIYLFSNQFSLQLNKLHITKQIKESLPLMLIFVLGYSVEYIDNFIVLIYCSSEKYAIFRYGAKELPIVLLLANSLSNSIIPEIANNKTQGLQLLKSETNKLIHSLFPLSIVLLISSFWLYPLIFSTAFQQSATIFNIYILLIISRLLFPQSILLAFGDTKLLLQASVFEVIVKLILSIPLFLFFGIYGLAVATVLSYISQKLLMIHFNKHKYHIPIKEYLHVKLFFFYSSLLIIFFTISRILESYN